MSPAAHRRLSLLALAAMLLLALLPTTGRLAGVRMPTGCEEATSAPRLDRGMPGTDMASMTPAQHRAHMAAMAGGAPRPALPSTPAGHDGHDCPYCPLLSGLHAAAALPWAPDAPPAMGPWAVRAVVARAGDAPVPALGSQGPPTVAA